MCARCGAHWWGWLELHAVQLLGHRVQGLLQQLPGALVEGLRRLQVLRLQHIHVFIT